MRTETADFVIDCGADQAVLRGVLRLPSPSAYEGPFEGIHKGLAAASTRYVVDICGVKFMNSSGITAISRLVLLARTLEKDLVFVGSSSIPWQGKTIRSLQRLYRGLGVELV